jgi:Protein of unknown function (DUF3500)
VERRGLRMGDLAHDQRAAVMTLLSAALSKMGYEKIVGIMDADGAHDRILLLRRQWEAIVAGGVGVKPLFPELV